jgi:hypothetical protein
MPDVRVIKFDVGSSTDQSLDKIRSNLHAKNGSEAFRRGVAIAQRITEAQAEGGKVFIQKKDGTVQELVIS